MKPFCALLLASTCLLGTGCNRDSAPVEVPIDQASAEVKTSFSGAPAELQKAAEEAAQSMKQGDYVQSYSQIEELSMQGDLTPEQRQKLGDSQTAVLKKLSEAAAAGDAQAAKALESHRSRK